MNLLEKINSFHRRMSKYNPDLWSEIASKKDFKLINAHLIQQDKFRSRDKLDLQCNKCEKIIHPTASEIVKPRFATKPCKCQTWELKKNINPEIDDNWRIINKIVHPMAQKYKLGDFLSYYMISREGKLKSSARKDCSECSPTNGEKYDRVVMRTVEEKYRTIRVDILVACAFVNIPQDEKSNDLIIRHKNENTRDNRWDNLIWEFKTDRRFSEVNSFWLQNSDIFFREEDFKQYGNSGQPVIIKQYKNFSERLQLEDEIKLENEIWKRAEIDGKMYFISSMGRCYYEKWNKSGWGRWRNGYLMFHGQMVHELVAKCFLSKFQTEDMKITHKNGRKWDNRISNLEYESCPILNGKITNSDKKEIMAAYVLQTKHDNSVSNVQITSQSPSLKMNDFDHCFNDGILRINEIMFAELKEREDSCSIIMKLLNNFSKPILPVITKYDCLADWKRLLENDSYIEDDSLTTNVRGRKLLDYFMLSVMIEGHRKGRPTYGECWDTPKLRETLVRRILKHDKSMNNRTFLNSYGNQHGRLYNFPPNVAKALYNNFKSRRVLDFCAGFGGRLTGFWASEAQEYVGIDPNKEIPYDELIDFLRPLREKTVKIIRDCAELVEYTQLGMFDTIFTSPPYFNTEIYSNDKSQSCNKYPKFKDWLEKFLFIVLDKVIRVLSPGGTLMINISDSGHNEIVGPMLEFLREQKILGEETHIKLNQSKRYRHLKTRDEYIYVWKRT